MKSNANGIIRNQVQYGSLSIITDDVRGGSANSSEFESSNLNGSINDANDDFYGAIGKGTILSSKERMRRRKLKEGKKAQVQSRKNLRVGSKATTRLSQADTQKNLSKSLGKETESDKQIAKALAKTSSTPGESKKPIIMKVVAGILFVGIIVGVVIYVKNKKKNKQ